MAQVRTDKVQVELDVNAEKANTELENLSRKHRLITDELKTMKKGTDEYIQANKDLTKVNKDISELREKLGLAGLNMGQLEKLTKELTREMKLLTPGTESFIKKSEELTKVAARLEEVKKQSKGIKDEQEKAGGFFDGIIGKALVFTGIGMGVEAIVDGAVSAASAVKETVQEFSNLRTEINQLTGATGEELDSITTSVRALGKTFNVDYKEVLIAANTVAKQMGISQDEALKQIENGFLAGADAGGQFLDQLTEYPAQFAAAGASAEEMISVITKGTKEGIFSDKGADVVKEFGLRIREQTQTTRDALDNAFGEEFTGKLFQNLNDGSITTVEALKLVSKGLNDTELSASQTQTVIADVFGGPGEDVGINYLKSLQDIGSNTEGLIDTTNVFVQRQQALLQSEKDLASAQNELTKSFDGGSSILTTLTNDSLTFLYTLLVGLVTVLGDLFAPIGEIWNGLVIMAEKLGLVSKEGNGFKTIANILIGVLEALVFPVRLAWQFFGYLTNSLINFVNSSPQLIFAIQQIISPFTSLFQVLSNAPAYLAGFEAAFKTTFGNVLNLVKAVLSGNFSGAKAIWGNMGKDISGSFNQGFEGEMKTGRERDLVEDAKHGEKKKKQNQGISAEEKKARDKAAADAKKAREKELEEEKKQKLAAAKAIEDLKNSLITNEFDKKLAILKTTLEREKKEAKGTAEQISEQKKLLEQKYTLDVAAIEKERTEKAKKVAEDRAKAELEIRKKILAQSIEYKVGAAANSVAAAGTTNAMGEVADPARLLAAKQNQLQALKEIELAEAQAKSEELLQQDLKNLKLTAEEKMAYELQVQQNLADEKLVIEQAYQQQASDLNKAAADERAKQEKEANSFALEQIQMGVQTLFDFKKIGTDREMAQVDKDKALRLKKLEQEYQAGKISKENYENSKNNIETNYDQKARSIKRRAAQDEKNSNIANSIMAGLLGVIKAAPNIPLQIATGILAGITTAKIIATPIPTFSKGGYFGHMGSRILSAGSSAWRGVRKFATGGAINPTAGIATSGQLHSGGGIKMIDGATGEHLGEWEKGEAYMILSRNTVANNGELVNRLLDSSLHRGGAKVHMAKGGLYADGGVSGSLPGSGAQDFGTLVQEVRGVREEIRTQKTLLKAYVVASEVGTELAEIKQIKEEASL